MTPKELREHLFRLEWTGKLEKHLPEGEPQMPWADVISLFPYVFYVSIGIHLARMVRSAAAQAPEGHVGPWETTPDTGAILWLLLLIVLSQTARFGWWLVRTREEAIGHRLRRRGKLLPASIVQVNERWFDPDDEDPCPAEVIVSFDRRATEQPELLGEIARRLYELKVADRRTLPPEEAAVAWTLYHEMAALDSIPVPESLSNGLRHCQLSSVLLRRGDYWHGGRPWVLALRRSRSRLAVTTIPATVLELPPVPWLKAFYCHWTRLLG